MGDHLAHVPKFLTALHPRKANNYIEKVGVLIDGSIMGSQTICLEGSNALDLNPGVQWQRCYLVG
jgi:hypothetical protein